MPRVALPIVVFVVFTAYSFTVLGTHGLVELVAVHRQGGWSVQIFLDLVISLVAFWIVAVPDARARGIRVWPYLVGTALLGSIAPLAYFVHRSLRSRAG